VSNAAGAVWACRLDGKVSAGPAVGERWGRSP